MYRGDVAGSPIRDSSPSSASPPALVGDWESCQQLDVLHQNIFFYALSQLKLDLMLNSSSLGSIQLHCDVHDLFTSSNLHEKAAALLYGLFVWTFRVQAALSVWRRAGLGQAQRPRWQFGAGLQQSAVPGL